MLRKRWKTHMLSEVKNIGELGATRVRIVCGLTESAKRTQEVNSHCAQSLLRGRRVQDTGNVTQEDRVVGTTGFCI